MHEHPPGAVPILALFEGGKVGQAGAEGIVCRTRGTALTPGRESTGISPASPPAAREPALRTFSH